MSQVLSRTHVSRNGETKPCRAQIRKCEFADSDMLLSTEDMTRANELVFQILNGGNFGDYDKKEIDKLVSEREAILEKGRERLKEEIRKRKPEDIIDEVTDEIALPTSFDDPLYQLSRKNVEDKIAEFLNKDIFYSDLSVAPTRKELRARNIKIIKKQLPGQRDYQSILENLKSTMIQDLSNLKQYPNSNSQKIRYSTERLDELETIIKESDNLSKLNRHIELENNKIADNYSEYDDPISIDTTTELFTKIKKKIKRKK